MKFKVIFCFFVFMAFLGANKSDACSRILYVGDTTTTTTDSVLRIVGRSLDWKTPIPTNLYVYPRGMKKKGNEKPGAVTWTSKYGAVYAVGYDGGITEGMNEKGLVINGLFCKGTVYTNEQTEGRPGMSLAVFIAWLLDMNATTPEVVDVLKKQDFNISGATFDGGTVSTLHWGITDAEGRSAILEFDHGVVKVYEGEDMPAMTNDPQYPAMTAINDYWKQIGGINMLPGTVRSSDRFVRGYFYQGHVDKTNDADLGLSIIRSILVNVSVPYLYTVETEPNVSSTQWRSFSNIRDRLYYFDIVTNMGVFYIDLKKCDLRPGAPVMKLDTSKSQDYIGDVTSRLVKHAPFTPMY
ncbi:MAG: linear amide C-N hydrolase [Muribaculum sp.]|nr:linear amide C-N hydrolase [Muribaculum sp.]